jgi:hypothetical protein
MRAPFDLFKIHTSALGFALACFNTRDIISNASRASDSCRRRSPCLIGDRVSCLASSWCPEFSTNLWSTIGAVVLNEHHHQIISVVHLSTEMILVPNSIHSSINSCNFHIIWHRPCFFNGLTRSISVWFHSRMLWSSRTLSTVRYQLRSCS